MKYQDSQHTLLVEIIVWPMLSPASRMTMLTHLSLDSPSYPLHPLGIRWGLHHSNFLP